MAHRHMQNGLLGQNNGSCLGYTIKFAPRPTPAHRAGSITGSLQDMISFLQYATRSQHSIPLDWQCHASWNLGKSSCTKTDRKARNSVLSIRFYSFTQKHYFRQCSMKSLDFFVVALQQSSSLLVPRFEVLWNLFLASCKACMADKFLSDLTLTQYVACSKEIWLVILARADFSKLWILLYLELKGPLLY